MNRSRAPVVIGALLLWFVSQDLSPRALAQVAGGTISGSIQDPSDAFVPGAEVKIASGATGVTRSLTTNGEGFYNVPNLNPGNYEITVTMAGFRVSKEQAILTIGAQLVVNIHLQLGNETEIQVQGGAPAVELASSSLSATVEGKEVRELPLNGRDWTSLATLNPGVHSVDTQTSTAAGGNARVNRGWGTQLNIGGDRPQQNVYRLDGVVINDYSGGGPGGVLGLALGVEAVQEFSVITGNASADYGRTSGGVINAITRSGTNQFHGNVYEFLRNSFFDARNFFDGTAAPPFKRNQFGASVGGPIAKNHTFFFFDYEGLRQNLSTTTVDSVPSVNAHLGNLTGGKVTVDPKVMPYLALYPLPNVSQNGDFGIYSFVGKAKVPEDLYTGRIDHMFNEKDSMHGTFLVDNSKTSGPDIYNFIQTEQAGTRKSASVEESHIFSGSLANFVRVGFSRATAIAPTIASGIAPNALDTSLGFVPGFSVGTIQVSGTPDFQGASLPSYIYHYTSYQLNDDLFYTRGAHSMKFGGYAERILSNDFGSTAYGFWTFGSLKNFLTNQPSAFSSAVPGSNSPIYLRQTVAAGYVVDDWRLRPNLTVNLGMRYEVATVPTEKYGHLSSLQTLTSTQPRLGSPLYQNPTWLDFSPRIGFSWDPFGTGKTAVRAAFGIYDVLPLTYEFQILTLNTAPYFLSGNVTSNLAGTFPKQAFGLINDAALKYSYIQQNPRRSYVEQWNFNIQRQLPWNLVLQTGYNGAHGVHLPFRTNDANIVLPTQTSAGLVWPTPRGSGTRQNPNVGTIDALVWQASTSYNGLTASLNRQVKALRVGVSYTYAKSLDDTSSSGSNFTNSIVSPWPQLPKLFRGPSDFDVRQLFVANYLWEIPGPQLNRFAKAIAGGWQLGGIFRVSTGLAFTPTISGDPLGVLNNNPFGFPDRLTGPGCSSAVNPGSPNHYIKTECFGFPQPSTRLGNSGRNILNGPGIQNFDSSLYKTIILPRLQERFKVQFRAEFFNLLNHPNFGTPIRTQSQIFNVSGNVLTNAGLLTQTSTTSREMQFALKFVF